MYATRAQESRPRPKCQISKRPDIKIQKATKIEKVARKAISTHPYEQNGKNVGSKAGSKNPHFSRSYLENPKSYTIFAAVWSRKNFSPNQTGSNQTVADQ
jgi:hypothetical protein